MKIRPMFAAGSAFLFLCCAGTVWSQDATVDQPAGSHGDNVPYYRSMEFSLDVFGTLSVDKHTLNHLSDERFRHHARLGAGLGASFFPDRYLGISGEAYSDETGHRFIENADGNLVFRIPVFDTGLAPYIFGGGGHKFYPRAEAFGQAGAGLEFRFTPHIGIFADGRYVWPDRSYNYTLGRLGLRIAF